MKVKSNFSAVIAGTMTWGSWGKQFSTSKMSKMINHCVDIGITSFDHADIYGGYSTEQDFGPALNESGVAREDIQLITKCGIQYVCEARNNKVKHYNYSSEYIIWSAEESLKKLKTEYLDLFLLHRPSPLMEPEEVAKAIVHLTKEGKVIDFGVSNFTPSQIALLETEVPVLVNQVEFSLTADQVMFDGTLDDCIAKDRTAMAWSPLGSYFREENEQSERIKEVMAILCPKYNADESQLLLAWIMRHPAGVLPVVGTTDSNRLMHALYASKIEMELEDWFLLHTASMGHKVP